jgi:hypothetical protein
MTYDYRTHRGGVRAQLVHLVTDGGPGWDEYAVAEARKYTKEDPSLHDGLEAAVRKAIAARAAKQEKANAL